MDCRRLAGWIASAATAMGADRTAEEILKDLDAVKMPTVDRSKVTDSQYVEQFRRDYKGGEESAMRLILELYKSDPDNAKLPPLMTEHWTRMSRSARTPRQARKRDPGRPGHGQEPAAQARGPLRRGPVQ